MKTLLRYDGKYTWIEGENRTWTIISHFIDKAGQDRFRSSFGLAGLIELEIVVKGA